MKKKMITLAIMISLATGVFAGNDDIGKEVLDAFSNKFTTAQDVLWSKGNNYYRASFIYNGASLFAYYNSNAELIGVARYISPILLPENLQKDLRKHSAGYWISDLFEVSNDESKAYYITLQDADSKIILESKDESNWQLFRRNKIG